MGARSLAVACTAGLCLVAPPDVFAHGGLSAGVLHITLQGGQAHVNATPSPALFASFDADGDGELTQAEVNAARDEMAAHFLDAFDIVGSWGAPPELVFIDLNPAAHLHEGEAPYVRVTLRLRFGAGTEELHVRYDGASLAPLRVAAIRQDPDGGGLRTTGQLDATTHSMTLFR